MEKFFPFGKIVLTGNPVPQDIISEGNRTEAFEHFQLNKNKKVVLIIGGSLGAGTINNSVLHHLDQRIGEESLQVLWQTGKYYFDLIKSNQKTVNREDLFVYSFIERMDLAYAAADIIVSRAGAIAISELCIVGKPAILIPSPNVAEDHQTKNAEALVRKSAALMLKDQDSVEKLFTLIKNLVADTGLQNELSRNIKTMALPGAARVIAEEIMKLIKSKE